MSNGAGGCDQKEKGAAPGADPWVGAEIAQVYLGLPASTGEPPRRLVGWAKVELAPGETGEITVTLDPNATSHPLSYWNVNTHGWETASGDYQVYVGASSRDIRATASFTLTATSRWRS